VPDDDKVGARIQRARKARGLTQQQLANRAHLSKSLVSKIEAGDRAATGGVVQTIATALAVRPDVLLHDAGPQPPTLDEQIRSALPDLERALIGHDLPAPADLRPRPLADLLRTTRKAGELRLAAQYGQLSRILPNLIDQLSAAAQLLDGHQRELAYWHLAVAYRCLDAIANKLGYLHLSYLAVDRVCWAAARSNDPLMIATGEYLRGQACLDVGRYGQGLVLLDRARGEAEASGPDSAEGLAVRGALHLRSAVLAALDTETDSAWDHIAEARVLAARVGSDVTHYWTLFGPSNVGIHAVATAVELGDHVRAIEEAGRFTLPADIPKERSSHHLIDLSRAYLWSGDRTRALDCLLKAERIAPQHTRHHAATRESVRVLLQLSRRRSDTLAGLADRVNVDA
jgi:transcriptional regulator with XRE-family HTH domain